MTDEAPTPDDEIDINLRSPEEIGVRLVILAALTRRLLVEDTATDEESADNLFDLRHWFAHEELDRQASADERVILNAGFGQLGPKARVAAEMASESLVALAWTVNLVAKLPPPDEPANLSNLLDRLPAPWDSVREFIPDLNFRPEDVIASERERAELWLWRTSIEAERLHARGPERADLDALIAETAREARQAGIISTTQAGDFSLGSRPFSRLTPDQQDLVATIAAARLHALNWACGFGASWTDVPLDLS